MMLLIINLRIKISISNNTNNYKTNRRYYIQITRSRISNSPNNNSNNIFPLFGLAQQKQQQLQPTQYPNPPLSEQEFSRYPSSSIPFPSYLNQNQGNHQHHHHFQQQQLPYPLTHHHFQQQQLP